MKTDKFLPFDDVVDSMAAAAARLNVPLESVKAAKRAGCTAFKGSRVNLGLLRKFFTADAQREKFDLSGLLLAIVRDVAHVVSEKLLEMRGDADFREDSERITQQIHLGLGLTAMVLEPERADWFLGRSAKMEGIFKRSTRKKSSAKSDGSNEP